MGGRLLVGDERDGGVLVWNHLPSRNFEPADLVLGQPSFASRGWAPPTSSSIFVPVGIAWDSLRLLIADGHRVLVWNTRPTTSGVPADLVLGQADFAGTSVNRGSTAAGAGTMNHPRAVWTDGARLFVGDTGNNRVLVWSPLPASSSQPADLVIGQPGFGSGDANHGGLSMTTLCDPEDEPLAYRWSQTAGVPVHLATTDAAETSFLAPFAL